MYNNIHLAKINTETKFGLFDIELTEIECARVGALRRHFCCTGSRWKLIRNYLYPYYCFMYVAKIETINRGPKKANPGNCNFAIIYGRRKVRQWLGREI